MNIYYAAFAHLTIIEFIQRFPDVLWISMKRLLPNYSFSSYLNSSNWTIALTIPEPFSYTIFMLVLWLILFKDLINIVVIEIFLYIFSWKTYVSKGGKSRSFIIRELSGVPAQNTRSLLLSHMMNNLQRYPIYYLINYYNSQWVTLILF